jgi:hypothetical protein
LVNALKRRIAYHLSDSSVGSRPRSFDLLLEEVSRFKKTCFYASLSHHKGNTERLVK